VTHENLNLSPALIWLVILCVGLGTFALRAAGIVILGKIVQPQWFERALRYVPPAILGALISSSLLIRHDTIDFSFTNVRLLAAMLAAVVAWWRKSLFWTIAAGMIALWVLTFGASAMA